jgi:hypothetical protein
MVFVLLQVGPLSLCSCMCAQHLLPMAAEELCRHTVNGISCFCKYHSSQHCMRCVHNILFASLQSLHHASHTACAAVVAAAGMRPSLVEPGVTPWWWPRPTRSSRWQERTEQRNIHKHVPQTLR